MTGEQTAKTLFWLGIVIMVVSVIADIYTFVHIINMHVVDYNIGTFVVSIFSPLWQGGLLIGIAKIIEILGKQN